MKDLFKSPWPKESFPQSIWRLPHIEVRRKLEGVTTQVIKECAKVKSILHTITQQPKKKAGWNSWPTQSLFTFLLQPPLLLRIEPLPISRISMAVQFLTSAPCCRLGVAHDFNALQCFTVKMIMDYTLYLAVVQSSTPTDFFLSPPVSFLLRSTGRLSEVFPCCLSLLFSWHVQGPIYVLFSFC